MIGRPHTTTKYKDAYAPSGYDLLSILVRSTLKVPSKGRGLTNGMKDACYYQTKSKHKYWIRRSVLRLCCL
jgi:hypothetical protein